MRLKLKRHFFGRSYTIGKLYVNDKLFCDTIEDRTRLLPNLCKGTSSNRNCKCKGKVATETAIPAGTYRVTMEYSPKFKRFLPYLHDVPHFLGILIHPGVDEKSSSGCIIVGKNKLKGKVLDSRAISDALNAILLKEKDIWITIE